MKPLRFASFAKRVSSFATINTDIKLCYPSETSHASPQKTSTSLHRRPTPSGSHPLPNVLSNTPKQKGANRLCRKGCASSVLYEHISRSAGDRPVLSLCARDGHSAVRLRNGSRLIPIQLVPRRLSLLRRRLRPHRLPPDAARCRQPKGSRKSVVTAYALKSSCRLALLQPYLAYGCAQLSWIASPQRAYLCPLWARRLNCSSNISAIARLNFTANTGAQQTRPSSELQHHSSSPHALPLSKAFHNTPPWEIALQAPAIARETYLQHSTKHVH